MKDYKKLEKRFYEKIWIGVGNWERKTAPYTRKDSKIEGKLILSFFKKHLRDGSRILDLGCGGGRYSINLAQKGYKTYGIDLAEHAIKLANKLKKEKRVGADFREGNVLDLPYENYFFDAVIDVGCFHHLRKSQWKKYINNVIRVLKKGGYYILYTYSTESGKTRGYNPSSGKNWNVRIGHYYHYFSKEEIKKNFGKHFKIINTRTIIQEDRILIFYLTFMRKL